VISGYLISAILVRQLGRSTFSIVEFYERRVRRIIPALFVGCWFRLNWKFQSNLTQ
jgi:peptidoglycan/LPS O-acetylase OafA/YrhL